MTITLTNDESQEYIKLIGHVHTLGIPFGAFVTKAMSYKVKIKSRDAIIEDQKVLIAQLKDELAAAHSPVKTVAKAPVATIPDMYAEQAKRQKEEEAAHTEGFDVLTGTKEPTAVQVTTNNIPAPKPVREKKKTRLNKKDMELLHKLTEGKVKASCSVTVFAAQRDLSPKTVETYINKHSKGKYKLVLGKDVKKSKIWPGASVHKEDVYFMAV